MTKRIPVLLALVCLLGAASAQASPSVCALLITSSNGYATAVQRSCDGEDMQVLDKKKNLFLEEVSYQLSVLYSYGLRLINCQVNNTGVQTEYVCIAAH